MAFWDIGAGDVLKAGTSLAGGIINRKSAKEAQWMASMERARDRALQKEFAQSGIQWRVEDAKKAGIHPLYALGGSGASYTPSAINISGDTSMGTAVAQMGQDIGSAINRTRTGSQRQDAFTETMQKLQLTRAGLENDLLASQIAKLRAAANPPMPAPSDATVPEADKYEDRPKLRIGSDISTDPTQTNAEDAETRYDEGGAFLAGLNNLWRDYVNTTGGAYYRARENPFHVEPRDPVRRWWLRTLEGQRWNRNRD